MAHVDVGKLNLGGPVAARPSAPAAPDTLHSLQLHALFDLLTHHQTYTEVERFKNPSTIAHYGYPFALQHLKSDEPAYEESTSASPLLAELLNRIVLPVPGIRDLPPEFWHRRFQGVLTKLATAELSESYDKGALGTRKTLATAASVIHEAVSRGILGGITKRAGVDLGGSYNRSKAHDLARAWEDGVHELVYGSLVEELFECSATRVNLEEHSPAIQACADYIILHLATFIHHVFVLSPEGPYLLKLVEGVHKLIPYAMIRQTLRVGNAATMINGMMKLLLSKLSVGAISNWFGLTQNADDGMNLLQRIISLVLSWDSTDFRKTVDKIERAKPGPNKEHLLAIKRYIDSDRSTHETTRRDSINAPTSIVVAILGPSASLLSEDQHQQCLDYYSALIAIRDRDEITKALCRQSPDLFTQAVKDLVSAFEPMIRRVHEKIDLRVHLAATESFITDFIATSKPNKTPSGISSSFEQGTKLATRAPSIEDYVTLLKKHRHSLYNWLYQVATLCPEIREDFRAWCVETVKVFQQTHRGPGEEKTPTNSGSGLDARRRGAAGAFSSNLQALYLSLPIETRNRVVPALDAHAEYLLTLENLSLQRMQHILDDMPEGGVLSVDDALGSRSSISGPGMFLSRWQQLLDDTVVGPAVPGGELRSGRDVKGSLAHGKTVSAATRDGWDPSALAELAERDTPRPPDVKVVVESLAMGFEKMVADTWRHKRANMIEARGQT
ncbi:hypothetical protein OQA88_8216 [Cercophora sp. LCS_1]